MRDGRRTGMLGSTRRAQRLFADAVLAFSDDPGPANLERYLAASRGLEELQRARSRRPQASTPARGAGAVVRPDATGVRI